MQLKNIWEIIPLTSKFLFVPVPYSNNVYFIKIPQTAADEALTPEQELILRQHHKIEELTQKLLEPHLK